MEIKHLQKKLLDIVNAEADEIKEGEPKRYSETGEDYIQLGCTFKKEQISKLLRMFKNAIKAYKDVAKITFVRKMKNINCDDKLKVYWRVTPEVDLFNGAEKEALRESFMTSRHGEWEKAEKEIKEKFVNIKKEDCAFYTRFLFTYQEKINGR